MNPIGGNYGSASGETHMPGLLRALVMLGVLLPLCAFAANEKVLVELNSADSADNRCRHPK